MTTAAAGNIAGVVDDSPFVLRIPNDLKPRLQKLAKREDRSLNAQIIRVLRVWADEQEWLAERAERGKSKP